MSVPLSPPECVRGMRNLKREEFKTSFRVPALKVEGKCCSILLKNLNKCLLNLPRFKNIVPDTEGDLKKKIVLLNPELNLDTEQENLVKSCECERMKYEVKLDYNYWTCDQVLRAVLPEDIGEVTTAFETIGHIAHMNLRDSQLDYKSLIGQVILDKNSPQIKTVVNKINTIDETYRFFKMELLAGEDNMVTTTKEHGCIFMFNFEKVYWNSRLQSEHKRLVEMFKPTDIICDMFAGVGPFAIPAAKKGCTVYANDLNPESFAALEKNCKLNHVGEKVHCFNMDGKDFVRNLVTKNVHFDHVLMNLPAMAIEFLDIFKGLYNSHNLSKLPIIHCYCFSKAENFLLDAQRKVESVLGVSELEDCKVFNVRNVAPKKMMLCVSFLLPCVVAFGEKKVLPCIRKSDEFDEGSAGDESSKRAKLHDIQ